MGQKRKHDKRVKSINVGPVVNGRMLRFLSKIIDVKNIPPVSTCVVDYTCILFKYIHNTV